MDYSSEGSLTQHIKLKHPDYFAKMGLTQINLKSLDDSKSLNESDLNPASSVNNNEDNAQSLSKETNKADGEGAKKKEKEKEQIANNNSTTTNEVVYLIFFFLVFLLVITELGKKEGIEEKIKIF